MMNFSFLLFAAKAQQLDQVGKKGGVKVGGGIGISNQFYHSNGESNLNIPANTYLLNGRINLNLYGWDFPFSISYSNRKFITNQPSNIIGVSPKYKNLTLHAGVRNMTFSPYTLNGHTFTGGGAEYDWRKKGLSFKAMGGRLLAAVDYDPGNPRAFPTYARNAGAVMVNYNKGGDQVKLIVFYALDNANSINPVPDSVTAYNNLTPQENIVYSAGIKKKISSFFLLKADGAISSWVSDTEGLEVNNRPNRLDKLFLKNPGKSFYYSAYNLGADFNFKIFSLGLGYEAVQPDFHTLGAYRVANDFENITTNVSTKLYKDKVQLSSRIGVQRNDLDDQKTNSNFRFVSGLNASVNASERLQFSVNYSGFNSVTKIKPVEQQYFEPDHYYHVDTANIVQLTNSFNGNINYKISENDNFVHNVSSNTSYQAADNKQSDQRFGNNMMANAINYQLMFKKTGLNMGTFVTGSFNEYNQGTSKYFGFGLNGGYGLFQKKVAVGLSINSSLNYEGNLHTATLLGISNNYSYSLAKGHSFNLNLRFSGRYKAADSSFSLYNKNLAEYFITVAYRYNFSKGL